MYVGGGCGSFWGWNGWRIVDVTRVVQCARNAMGDKCASGIRVGVAAGWRNDGCMRGRSVSPKTFFYSRQLGRGSGETHKLRAGSATF